MECRLTEIYPGPFTKSYLSPNILATLGVTDNSQIEIINDWKRGGTETYVSDFIFTSNEDSRHLIAKACVKFGPREAMSDWLDRRQKMQENGVLFPQLVAVDGATIVEEYIPLTFAQAYRQSDENQREILRKAYIDTYKRICGAGFSPISLHDVRSRGVDIVVVDPGQDIGGYVVIDYCDLSTIVKAEKSFRETTK